MTKKHEIKYRIQLDPAWLGIPMILEAGADSTTRSSTLRPHSHPGFELTYLQQGEENWKLENGENLRFSGGEIALTQPGMNHWGDLSIIRPSTLYWLVFDPLLADGKKSSWFLPEAGMLAYNQLKKAGNVATPVGDLLPGLFMEFHQCLIRHLKGPEDALTLPWAQSLALQIVMEAVRRFSENTLPKDRSVSRLASEFMEHQMDNKMPVEKVAAHVGLSPGRFHHVFKKETGQTPTEYLQRLRCAKASEALKKTDESVTAIAFRHGFSSSQYFSKCFRKYTRMTPSEFRKNKA